MAVVRGGNVKAMVTRTIRVMAAAPGPAPEPAPEPEPSPGPQPPPSQGPSDDDGDGDDEPEFDIPQNPPPPESGSQLPDNGDVPAPALMTPFPIVRIAGLLLPGGARVRVLSVRAPRGAVVNVHCHGEGCPLRSVRQRVRRRVLRVERLERLLNAGVRLEIYVRQRNRVGKYTRIRIQAGRRPPLRVDRCVRPGGLTPIRCPFSTNPPRRVVAAARQRATTYLAPRPRGRRRRGSAGYLGVPAHGRRRRRGALLQALEAERAPWATAKVQFRKRPWESGVSRCSRSESGSDLRYGAVGIGATLDRWTRAPRSANRRAAAGSATLAPTSAASKRSASPMRFRREVRPPAGLQGWLERLRPLQDPDWIQSVEPG